MMAKRGFSPEQDGEEDAPSRSQRKRDSTALQQMGEQLAAMAPAQHKTLGLPDDLREALLEYQHLRSREAKRRQMQYIGRLMREAQADGQLDTVIRHLSSR